MSGKKGRSGKATTLEAKLAKAAGGRKAGRGRPASASAPALPAREAGLDPKNDDPIKRLGRPLTWGDELKRAQVDGEKIANRKREVEVARSQVELQRAKDEAEQSRGRLVERSEKDRAVAQVRDRFWSESQQVAGLVLLRLADQPGEVRAAVKTAIDLEIAAMAERVKTALLTG